jgi:hypothetical protein
LWGPPSQTFFLLGWTSCIDPLKKFNQALNNLKKHWYFFCGMITYMLKCFLIFFLRNDYIYVKMFFDIFFAEWLHICYKSKICGKAYGTKWGPHNPSSHFPKNQTIHPPHIGEKTPIQLSMLQSFNLTYLYYFAFLA